MKKGQVTIFILLGLLILLFVGFFVFFASVKTPALWVKESPALQAVRASFSACLETQLQKAITTVALHGGYFEEPPTEIEKYLSQNISSGIPYYFDNEENVAPSQQGVEQQLALALQSRVTECTDFRGYPYNISVAKQTAAVTTTMSPGGVEAIINIPLEVYEENKISRADTFPVYVDSSLLKLYTTALEMTQEQTEHPTSICLTCLTQLTTNANAYLGMIELSQENKHAIIYVLNDRDPKIKNQLSFYFAHGFVTTNVTENLAMTSIESQTATIGYTYTYQVHAIGKDLTFSDNSAVFDIDPKTGIISFTPTPEDIGSWIVRITATDADNNKAETSFVFEVTDVVASELSLEALPYFVAHVGKEFNYTIDVTANESVYLLDDSELFDINPETGLIHFTPTSAQLGSYNFTITAIDTAGNSAEQKGYLVITP